jgi:hypothetical protein
MKYQAIYYCDPAGREPVNEAIDSLGAACQESVDWLVGLLNLTHDGNPTIPYPYSSALRGAKYRGLRELRADCGKTHHRIIYARSDRFWILLHMILNKTDEIPESDKAIGLARWLDFKARMDANPRANPRAMGHDAP